MTDLRADLPIPVGEDMPEYEGCGMSVDVLCWCPELDGGWRTGWYDRKCKVWRAYGEGVVVVTYWLPLPTKPKGNQ